jgi:hypothetical protein
MIAWVAFFVLSTAAIFAQSPSTTQPLTRQPGEKQGVAMKQFVLIFRQGKRDLSPEELSRRADEIKAWAAALNKEGRKLDPRALSQDTYRIAPEGESGANGERLVTNLLFLEAGDFDEAMKIAKTHPGTRYGGNIEVRAWASPTAPAEQARRPGTK